MSNRDTILQKVRAAKPQLLPLPLVPQKPQTVDAVKSFQTVLESIGGRVVFLNGDDTIEEKITSLFPQANRIVSSMVSVEKYFLNQYKNIRHHSLQDVDVAVIEARFGVAENGAVWVTEEDLKVRVLPFICEHLVAIVDEKNILPTMHDAYAEIGSADYSFGVFIAGPSKTADIEQSLVLGAHGPKTMTVLLRRTD